MLAAGESKTHMYLVLYMRYVHQQKQQVRSTLFVHIMRVNMGHGHNKLLL